MSSAYQPENVSISTAPPPDLSSFGHKASQKNESSLWQLAQTFSHVSHIQAISTFLLLHLLLRRLRSLSVSFRLDVQFIETSFARYKTFNSKLAVDYLSAVRRRKLFHRASSGSEERNNFKLLLSMCEITLLLLSRKFKSISFPHHFGLQNLFLGLIAVRRRKR